MIINIQISILNCLHFGTSKKYFLLYMDFRSGIWSSTTGISTTDRNKVLRHILKPSWWALQSQGDQIVDINLMIKSFLLQKGNMLKNASRLTKLTVFITFRYRFARLHHIDIEWNDVKWFSHIIWIVLEICNQCTALGWNLLYNGFFWKLSFHELCMKLIERK